MWHSPARKVCIGLLAYWMRQEGARYWDLFQFDRVHWRRDLLLVLGLLAVTVRLVLVPNFGIATVLFGDAQATTPPIFRPLPLWAIGTSIVVFPITIALAELPLYFGYAMPRLGSGWGPALLAAFFLSIQHAALPLIFDWRFIIWRASMFSLFALLLAARAVLFDLGLSAQGKRMTLKEEIFEAVVNGDISVVDRLVPEALAAGIPAEELLYESLIAGMTEVGARFASGDYYVAEMLVSAHAMKAGLKHLRPLLTAAAIDPVGTVVLGTVKGDLHDIGKNLVAMMLEGAGFRVVDLGVDVPPQRFAQAARETGAEIVALSALLTTTMTSMQAVVEALKTAGLREQVKVLIGGAPVTQAFADRIGADAFAADAAAATIQAHRLLGHSGVNR